MIEEIPLAPPMARQVRDYVLIKTCDDIDRRLRTFPGSNIEAAVTYSVLGDLGVDKMFVGRVVDFAPPEVEYSNPNFSDELEVATAIGCARPGGPSPETVARVLGLCGAREQKGVQPEKGNIVLCWLGSVSYRLKHEGKDHFLIRKSVIAATLSEELQLRPEQHYVLVRRNEERTLNAINSGGRVWLPTEEFDTDDERSKRRTGIKAEYGEVLGKGPGAFVDGEWVDAQCQRGDMVMYDASHSTIPIVIQGTPATLVAGHQVVMVADENPDNVSPDLRNVEPLNTETVN